MNVPLIVVSIGLLMILCEAAGSGRKWPRVDHWWFRAILLNGIQAGVIYLSGIAWDDWMLDRQKWPLAGSNTFGAALLGYFVLTFVYYWWHRARHEFPFLWRWFHQLHHSPQRIEIVTSFYKHPFEIIANSILSSAVVFLILGLTPEAAAGAMLISGLAELFYHWNVSTPRWVGFLIQRPESHCVHHQEGLHSYNYSDLPIWDMLFGTFHNPKEWNSQCGFADNGELQVIQMLRGMDIAASPKSE